MRVRNWVIVVSSYVRERQLDLLEYKQDRESSHTFVALSMIWMDQVIWQRDEDRGERSLSSADVDQRLSGFS